MNELKKSNIEEIIKLHYEICDSLKLTIDKAIQIGRLLIEQKKKLKHGNFLPWIKNNLPFSDRTARNYMKIFENKEKLKMESVSNLNDAYKLLEPSKECKVKSSDVFEEPKEENFYTGINTHSRKIEIGKYYLRLKDGISYEECIEVFKRLSYLKLPGENEMFLIGDFLGDMEKLKDKMKLWIDDFENDFGLKLPKDIEKMKKALSKWKKDWEEIGKKRGWIFENKC